MKFPRKTVVTTANDDYYKYLDFGRNADDRQPYISNFDMYFMMKSLVKIQTMNYYLLGKKHRKNTLVNRLMDKTQVHIYNHLKMAALLSVNSVMAKEQQERKREQQN